MGFERFISDDIVEFVIGPSGSARSFYINREFIAEQSPALRALVCGGMRESIERRVVFRELDPQTFVYFAEFAISRTYGVGGSEYGTTLDGVQLQRDYMRKADRERWSDTHADQPLPGVDMIYEDELLQSAKLYVFGDAYGVEQLKIKALGAIDYVLEGLDVDNDFKAKEIVKLVQYAYTYTADEFEERLRQKIIKFCARRARSLMAFEEFNELVTEGGSFALELMKRILSKKDSGSRGPSQPTSRGFYR